MAKEKVIVRKGRTVQDGKGSYGPGTVLEVSSETAKALSRQGAVRRASDDPEPEAGGGGVTQTRIPDPAEYTVGDLEHVVAKIDDADIVRGMDATERQGKARSGAFEVFAARLAELAGEE